MKTLCATMPPLPPELEEQLRKGSAYDALAAELAAEIRCHQDTARQMLAHEARIREIEAALVAEIDAINEYNRGSTHFGECWKSHRQCAAARRMEFALARAQSETEGNDHG